MTEVISPPTATFDVLAINENSEWGIGLGVTDIDINAAGDYNKISGATKCSQEVMVAILWLKNANDPINKVMGSPVATIYGSKMNVGTLLPVLQMQILDSLKYLYAAQTAAGLPDTEVINLKSIKLSTSVFEPEMDKRVLVVSVAGETVFGEALPTIPIPLG